MRWIKEHKLIFSLLSLLIALALVFVLSMSSAEGGNALTSVVNGGNSGVAGFLSSVGGNISDGARGLFAHKDLQRQVDELKAQNDELRQQLAEVKLEAGQLAQLQELSGILNYDYTEAEFNVVSADITLRDNSSWTDVFTIDRGSETGIREGCVVIDGVGLVGRVCEVGKGWAKVKPIINENNNISFYIARDNAQLGVVSGGKKGTFKGYMLEGESTVAESDILITSGMGLYPAGIEIGSVTSVSYNDDKLMKEITVEPIVDFKSLRKVAVII